MLSDTNKLVFSRTLQQAEGNTQIISGNLEAEIRKLKNRPGKNISVGGIDPASRFMANGIIDEFHFCCPPDYLNGRTLLQDINLPQQLNLPSPQIQFVSFSLFLFSLAGNAGGHGF